MATVYGVNRTKINAMSPANLLAAEIARGKVRAYTDEYTLASTASGTVIDLCPDLPKGAVIVGWVLDHAALGTGVTLALGSYASNASLMAAADCAAAGKKTSEANGVSLALPLTCDVVTSGAEETKLKVTTGGATGTGKIILTVFVAEKS